MSVSIIFATPATPKIKQNNRWWPYVPIPMISKYPNGRERCTEACMHCICWETAAYTKSHLAVDELPRGPAVEMKSKWKAYLASSSCFSRALRLAFLPWVLARRALASDSISSSVHSQKSGSLMQAFYCSWYFSFPFILNCTSYGVCVCNLMCFLRCVLLIALLIVCVCVKMYASCLQPLDCKRAYILALKKTTFLNWSL